MVLSQGSAKYVNGNTRGRAGKMVLADGPFAQLEEEQLHSRIWSNLGTSGSLGARANLGSELRSTSGSSSSSTTSASNFSLRIRLETETNRRYPADRVWAKHLDKSERGMASSLRRQQLHLLQWGHLRDCMFLVDAEEQGKAEQDQADVEPGNVGSDAGGRRFGLVLKLREDSVALQPWIIPRGWDRRGLTSLRCMKWGGVMDSTFAIGRRWAWTIMEGLAADWYISHFQVENRSMYKTIHGIPYNPESWLARLARLKQVPVQTKSICELPFVSARYVRSSKSNGLDIADGLEVVVKRHHYFAVRYDMTCFGVPRVKHNSTDGVASRTWHGRRDCAGAVRAAVESIGVCPSQLCATR